MFSLLTFLFAALFNLFKSKKKLIVQISLQKMEMEILLRKNQKKRLKFFRSDRLLFSILNRPPVDEKIKQIILSMKNDNLYWEYKKFKESY